MAFKIGVGGGGGGVSFGPPTAVIDLGDTQQSGAATTAARSDHQHAFPAAASPPLAVAAASAPGSATTPARSDHTHAHTAADHLTGGHADLSGQFAAASAPGAAVAAHESTYDHTAYDAAVSAVAFKIGVADHAGINHAGLPGVPANLSDLGNVEALGAIADDVLTYDGSKWVPGVGGAPGGGADRAFAFFTGGS